MKQLKLTGLLGTLFLLAACGGTDSPVVAPLTKNDKNLNCDELQLEINDAEFMRGQAMKNKGLNLKNVVWPLGYPATYSSAEEAIEASNTRIAYLTKIYEIKGCDDPYKKRKE